MNLDKICAEGKSRKGVAESGDKTGMRMLGCSIYIRFPQVDNCTTVT